MIVLRRPLALAATVLGLLAALTVPVRAAGLPSGVRLVELKAPRPAWFTPELGRRVAAAGHRGVPLPPGG